MCIRDRVKIGTLDKEYPLEGLFDPSFYVKAVSYTHLRAHEH